jgi:hypothetical protein
VLLENVDIPLVQHGSKIASTSFILHALYFEIEEEIIEVSIQTESQIDYLTGKIDKSKYDELQSVGKFLAK